MKFLALVLALVIAAEGIKVKSTDESNMNEKWGFFTGKPYYQWGTCHRTMNEVFKIPYRCCNASWGAGPEVSDSKCR